MPTTQPSKKRKRHPPEEDAGSGVTKKRKHSRHKPTTTEEVESLGGIENQEHAQILGSVTGKIDRLPLEVEEEGLSVDQKRSEEKRKKGDGGVNEGAKESQASKLAAAEYLVLWERDRESWAFRKKTQYWLLQNMYEKKKVSKSHFQLLVQYLAGLRGNQRGLAIERAKEVMAESELTKDTEPNSKIKFKRASKILRALEN